MRSIFLVLSFYGICSVSSFVLQGGITNSSVKFELSFQDLLRLVEGDGHLHEQASLNASIHSELADLKTALKYLIGDVKKAKGNREHLQKMYTDLKMEFAGVSEALANLTRKYDRVLEENSYLAEVNRNLTEEYQTSRNRTSLLINGILKNLTDVKGALAQLRQDQGLDVGFEVQNPKNESNSTVIPLAFNTVDYNSGNSYNVSSGKFTCRYPGLYFFAATITRKPGIRESYCCISLNGNCLVFTVATGDDLTGYLSGTTTLVKYLNTHDEVYLSACHGIDHMLRFSQFSGVLIQPDLH